MLVPAAWAVLLAAAGTVQAGPKISVSVDGTCPSHDAVRAAFEESPVVADDSPSSPWMLRVTRTTSTHTTRIALERTPGHTAFEREIQGDDCSAIAGVAAVIVEAYFLQIHVLSEPHRSAPPAPRPAPPPASPWWLWGGLSAGRAFYFAPALSAWSGEMALGMRYRHWMFALAGSYAAPTTQRDDRDRVERSELALHWDSARRFKLGNLWLEPGVALYLLASRVTALDLPNEPSTTRFDFGAGGFVVAGIPLTTSLSLTLTGAAAALLRRDRYAIEPTGVVARSPAERLFLGLGLRYELHL